MVPMPVSDAAGPHEDIGDTLAKPEHLAMGEDMTWRVTVLTDDGSWVPVPVEAESMEEAVAAIIDRRGVANVVECEPWDAWSRRHRPRFKVGDAVRFETKWGELSGTVEVVDYRGRERMSFKGCDWSYDVFVHESPACDGEPCLHKHVPERDVRPA